MKKSQQNQLKSSFLLLLGSLVWGLAFVAQSIASDTIDALTFNGIRFIIGGICLLPLMKGHNKLPGKIPANKLIGGVICGAALFLASTFQQLGIAMGATAGESGFLTACYIVIVPVMGIFIGKKCPALVWPAVAIALAGLYFLCIPAGEGFKISAADTMLLMCAAMFSVQILCVDHYGPLMSPVALACTEFFVSGAISLLAGFIFKLAPDPAGWINSLLSVNSWIAILYTGIFSSAIGYTLQIVGQRNLPPAVASLIMSLESVFSTIFGWLILRQVLTSRQALGCLLIFGAVIIAQLPQKNHS